MAVVEAVAASGTHSFSKPVRDRIEIDEALGVAGDAHRGVTVQHRSRVRRNPSDPNLRQVHLIHAELLDELARDGFTVAAGELGENVTTRGVDLLGLPVGTRLRIGDDVVLTVTGLRNPCVQIDTFRPGLLKRLVRPRPGGGEPERLCGVMATATRGGAVAPGDPIEVELPPQPHLPLTVV